MLQFPVMLCDQERPLFLLVDVCERAAETFFWWRESYINFFAGGERAAENHHFLHRNHHFCWWRESYHF